MQPLTYTIYSWLNFGSYRFQYAIDHLLWFCVFQPQRSSLTLQPQQNPLPASLYNTMMIPQQSSTNVVQIATTLAQNTGANTPAVATFAQDRAAQIRLASFF